MADPHTLETPETKQALIIALALEPVTITAAAQRFGVSRQAIYDFQERHAAEIDALKERGMTVAQDVALSDKAERIRWLAWLAQQQRSVLEEHGFMWDEPHGEKRTVERPPVALIKELRSTLRDIAEERGQIPRSPNINVIGDLNVGDNRRMVNAVFEDDEAADAVLKLIAHTVGPVSSEEVRGDDELSAP